jgi:hypothetical protein
MDDLQITQLPRNPYALGLIVHYLGDRRPFADFEFGSTTSALMFQLHQGTHLIATRNDKIVGYLGWLRVDPEIAEAWLNGETRLFAREDGAAVVVTIFATDDPRDIRPMIRAAKRAEPGRSVYWKRYFGQGRAPDPRSVLVRG